MLTFLIVHIGGGINVDQKTYAGNNQQENHGKRVYLKGKRNVEIVRMDKIKTIDNDFFKSILPDFLKNQQTHNKGCEDCCTANQPRPLFGKLLAKQADDQE